MTTRGSAQVTLPSDEEILITRDFNAPRHLVYKAWTTPELVMRWWAGKEGEMKSADIDLRVGGMWRYVMVANAGHEVAFHGTYHEIVPDERIVTTEVYEMPGADEADAPVDTITFVEADGQTRLTLLMVCSSKELRDFIMGSGFETGMQSQMDLLEDIAISLGAVDIDDVAR